MSHATMQQLVLVSVIQSGLKAVKKCHEVHDPEFKSLLDDALAAAEKMVIAWPISGDEAKHQKFVEEVMTKWQVFLEAQPSKWSMVVDVGVSIQVLDDLHHRLRDKGKRAALDEVLPRLCAVSDWLDARGTRVADFGFSSMCLAELYKIIGF